MADNVVTRFRFIADTKKGVSQLKNAGKQIQRNLGRVEKQAKKTNKGIGRLGGGMVSAAFQFGFAAAITGAAFNQLRMVIEQTVTEGASAIDKMTRAIFQSGVKINDSTDENIRKFKEFRDFITDMGTGKTIFGIGEVADAVKEVGKAVQDPANTIPIATEALKLMTIEEVGAAQAAQGLVKIFKIYKDEISDIREITDVLVSVNQQSSITLDQLIRSFKFAAQAGKAFGLTLSETGAFLGVLNEQVGTAGGGPGRAFRALLSELKDPATALNKQLRDLNITLLDQHGNFRDLEDIAKDFRATMGKFDTDIMQAQILKLVSAGRQGEAALLALVNTTEEDLADALKGAKVRGLADELNEAFGKTPEAAIKKMKGAIEGLKVAFVIGLTPAINALSESLQAIIRDPEIQEFFISIGKIVANEVIPLVKFMTQAFRKFIAIIGKNKAILQSLTKVFIAFAGALLVVSILAAVATLVVLVGKAFGFLALTLGLSTIAMLRLFAVAVLLLAIFSTMKNFSSELGKSFGDLSVDVLALNAAVAIGAAALAGFVIGGPFGALIAVIAVAGFMLGQFIAKLVDDFVGALNEADAAARKLGFNTALEEWFSNLGASLGLNFDPLILMLRQFGVDWDLFWAALFDPNQDAFANLFRDLANKLLGIIDFNALRSVGEAIINNIIFSMTSAIENFTGFIDKIINLFAEGNYAAIPQAIWEAILNFFSGKSLIEAIFGDIGLGNVFGGFDPIRDLTKFFGDIFDKDSDLQKNAEELSQKLSEETENHDNYVAQLIKAGASLEEVLEAHKEQFKALEPAIETINTLTITQNEKIKEEQSSIESIKKNIIEVSGVTDEMIETSKILDKVQIAFDALIIAVNQAAARARAWSPGGSSGGGSGTGDLQSRGGFGFAHGGIVTRPTVATVGDVPGGEAIIPLNRLSGIIQNAIGGAGSRGNITINANISIDNSSGRLSADEIQKAVVDGLAKDLPKKIFLHNTS